MKKLLLTLMVVLGFGLAAIAQPNRGFFDKGNARSVDESGDFGYYDNTGGLMLPNMHGYDEDYNADPLGTGIALLAGLGAAYLVGKRNRKE